MAKPRIGSPRRLRWGIFPTPNSRLQFKRTPPWNRRRTTTHHCGHRVTNPVARSRQCELERLCGAPEPPPGPPDRLLRRVRAHPRVAGARRSGERNCSQRTALGARPRQGSKATGAGYFLAFFARAEVKNVDRQECTSSSSSVGSSLMISTTCRPSPQRSKSPIRPGQR